MPAYRTPALVTCGTVRMPRFDVWSRLCLMRCAGCSSPDGIPMKSKLALAPPVSPPRRSRLRLPAALACLLMLSACALAREGGGLPRVMQPQDVAERQLKQRSLRSIFISSHDQGAELTGPAERRRLNAEERSALHRDLRDAMRGAYPDHSSARSQRR